MLPVARPTALRKAVGDKWFERIAATSLGSADELFAILEKYQIQCDQRRNGWLRANHCDDARIMATQGAKEWNNFGAGFEFCDAVETENLTGTSAYKSATLNRKGGAVHPLKLITGLASAARNAGAKIYSNAGVERLVRNEGRWVATCGQYQITADRVVVGTNGYTDGNVWKPFKNAILPLCPIQFATDDLPEELSSEILSKGHTISDTRRLIMYARRETNGAFVFGGIGFKKPGGNVGGYSWLEQDIRKIFPQLSGYTFKYRWTGQIGLTQNRVPLLNEPQPGLLSGMGYNGRGVAMANVMGRIMADRVLGKSAEQLDFPVTPLKRMALRNTQLFGAPLAMAWWRYLDNREFRN
jgi:sarcosine oxidase